MYLHTRLIKLHITHYHEAQDTKQSKNVTDISRMLGPVHLKHQIYHLPHSVFQRPTEKSCW